MEKVDRYQPDDANWRLIESELRLTSPYLNVFREKIIPPSKQTPLEWTVVRRRFAVVVAPVTEEGRFVLVRQERIPVRLALWEFPAGQVESSEPTREALLDTLHRELREETGYSAKENTEIRALGYFFSSQGFTDEHSYLFVARPVVPMGNAAPEEDESILDVREFSANELRSMIADNEIRDANTLALFARLVATGGLSF